MQMNYFGKRLREERERLGLNQEAFGAIGGVKKLAQLKYEKGERAPDALYLAAIKNKGVDIVYLLTGERDELKVWEDQTTAFHNLLLYIGERMGIACEVMEGLMFAAWQEEENGDRKEMVGPRTLQLFEKAWVKLPKPEVHWKTLEAVLEAIDGVLGQKGCVIPSRKKATIAVMQYQAARATGKVDLRMIEYAVSLAVE